MTALYLHPARSLRSLAEDGVLAPVQPDNWTVVVELTDSRRNLDVHSRSDGTFDEDEYLRQVLVDLLKFGNLLPFLLRHRCVNS
ncbi:hypothetical protein C474_06532 [Halogeometricum pallidum JCM 14848]|uniref:Uncharacterized protein n=1 Tax=Halogeometricum pallidum JCM 14848 TaxID=1227487 RepID=M0DAI1_HALPD|nr:hypothetical protein C474_06532 [Halogeometricum pallidum JCM 14848]